MPATPYRDTDVVDLPWDGPATEAKLSDDDGREVYEQVYAWRDPDADEDTKGAYRLPHHEVDDDGNPGAANVNGVRNALSRLPQSTAIPQADHDAVRRHLQRHLDKYNEQNDDEGNAVLHPAVRSAAVHVIAGCHAWAIDPRALGALYDLDRALFAHHRAQNFVQTRVQSWDSPRRSGSVAVVPLRGLLFPPMGGFFDWFFGSALGDFQEQFSEALADPDVEVIVIDVDSPGGMIDLIPETADQVRQASKPIVAVANTQAASAAYWIASQADEIVVTPSGETGSVGVYWLHEDISGMNQQLGIRPTLIAAGRYKTEGNPYEPLGNEARAAAQADVDDYYGMFVRAVASGRGVDVPPLDGEAFGGGRVLHAQQAVTAGLADRVGTLADTLRRVMSPSGRAALKRRRAQQAADVRLLDSDRLRLTISPPSPITYTPTERERLLAVMGQQP